MQLVVGRIGRPHGVRGAVTVDVRTDEPELRFAVGSALATDPADVGPLTITSAHWHSGRLLLTFDGYADRTKAEELRGTWLTVDSADVRSSDDPDEFHDHELIGLAVVTASGEPVGVVSDVRHFGQDLLVIQPGGVTPGTSGPGTAGPGGTGQGGTGPGGTGPGGAGPAGPGAARPGGAGLTGPAQRGQRGQHDEALLVPFVAAIVPEIDVAAGRLVIDPPPGLLDLGTA
jgi:16S rRNA processing protein RimM